MQRIARLAEVEPLILPADLLLWRGGDDPLSRMIRAGGRSIYRHAAMVGVRKEGHELTVLEVKQWVGGREVPLADAVARYPSQIDVFEAAAGHRWPEFSRCGAVAHMRGFVGRGYGLWSLFCASLLHMPFIRLLVRPDINDYANGRTPFCSQAVAIACRLGGGVDPVPNCADHITEPGDLARSAFYRYRFTLIP